MLHRLKLTKSIQNKIQVIISSGIFFFLNVIMIRLFPILKRIIHIN